MGSTGARAAGVAGAQDSAPTGPLTNLAHLQWLLDSVPLQASSTHTTYEIAARPTALAPWTYADAQAAGGWRRVGGGSLDPTTGYWSQGAYNADDIARAAVVFTRHWVSTGSEPSRDHAVELLRTLTFLQDATGPYAGNVVLWMQADGTLNPSAEPRELPDPSDSDESYWLARTVWALGEGYAAFAAVDPRLRRLPARAAPAGRRRARAGVTGALRHLAGGGRRPGARVVDHGRRRRNGRGVPRARGIRRRRSDRHASADRVVALRRGRRGDAQRRDRGLAVRRRHAVGRLAEPVARLGWRGRPGAVPVVRRAGGRVTALGGALRMPGRSLRRSSPPAGPTTRGRPCPERPRSPTGRRAASPGSWRQPT